MAESEADRAYLIDLVRTYDRPRYYSVLFAPRALQDELLALYAFAAEIGRIPGQVNDATLGEIRLQWWQDSLEGAVAGRGAGTPILRSLADVIARRALPLDPFRALIDATTADLYSDPPATLVDLEGRLGETQSALFQIAAIICGSGGRESADAAGHAGIAYGLALRLSNIGAGRIRGRTFLPLDTLSTEGLEVSDVLSAPPRPELVRVIMGMVAFARGHLADAQQHLRSVPRHIRPAFLPLVVAEPLLSRIARQGGAILQRPAVLSDIAMLTRIGFARLAGQGRGAGQGS